MSILSSSSSSTSTSTLRIGIVGFGPFAQFLAKTMIKQGHILRATSRSDHSSLCQDLGISFFRDTGSFVEADNDVILICTSILSLSEVLNSMPLHCLRRSTLFADVLSVKEHPRDILLKMNQMCCALIQCLGQRDDATCSSFLRIFEREGCRMLEMSCEEHDSVAARTQFLTHTIGRILSEMEVHSTSMDTKGFETLVHLIDSTMNDSFDLFPGLFVYDRFAKQELKNIELSLGKVKQMLLKEMNEEQNQNESKL